MQKLAPWQGMRDSGTCAQVSCTLEERSHLGGRPHMAKQVLQNVLSAGVAVCFAAFFPASCLLPSHTSLSFSPQRVVAASLP